MKMDEGEKMKKETEEGEKMKMEMQKTKLRMLGEAKGKEKRRKAARRKTDRGRWDGTLIKGEERDDGRKRYKGRKREGNSEGVNEGSTSDK